MSDLVTVPTIAPSAAVSFYDRRADFRRLVFRGALLELVTVGFYRFWLATDIRRHLWSHTAVEGDAAEYTGTAKELLLGFLFALVILGPIYFAYFLVGLEAERWKAFASTPLVIFFYLFYQFANYRARRYRLTRTVWRGVRFSMGGSGLSYMWRVALWALLLSITFGIVLPWRQAALERYKMRHTSYGNLPGRFDGTGGGLFRRGWLLWLVSMIVFVTPFAIAATGPRALTITAFTAQVLAVPFIYAVYKAIEWRWWASGIRFGDVSLQSGLRRGAMIGLYWKVIGWIVVLMVVSAIWFGAIIGIAYALLANPGDSLAQSMGVVSTQLPVMIGSGIGYIATLLAIWMLMRIYLIHDVWRRVAESVSIRNLSAAHDVAASGELAGALGEGFAGSLDVVGF